MGDDTYIDSVKREGEWITLEVIVQDVWESSHPAIHQIGLLTDGTGTIQYIEWVNDSGDNFPPIEEGQGYRLESLVTSEYEDDLQVKFIPGYTEIESVDNPRPDVIDRLTTSNRDTDGIESDIRVSLEELINRKEKGLPFGVRVSGVFDENPWTFPDVVTPSTARAKGANKLLMIHKDKAIISREYSFLHGRSFQPETVEEFRAVREWFENCEYITETSGDCRSFSIAECEDCGHIFPVSDFKSLDEIDGLWWVHNENDITQVYTPEWMSCPECGCEDNIFGAVIPSSATFTRVVVFDPPVDTVDDVEDQLSDYLGREVTIEYTEYGLLKQRMDSIASEWSGPEITEMKVRSTGDRGQKGIKRRYIRFKFDTLLTSEQIEELENIANRYNESISRIDHLGFAQNSLHRVDLLFHKIDNK